MDFIELKPHIYKIISIKDKKGEEITLKSISQALETLCGGYLPNLEKIKLAIGSLIADGIVGSDYQYYLVKKG